MKLWTKISSVVVGFFTASQANAAITHYNDSFVVDLLGGSSLTLWDLDGDGTDDLGFQVNFSASGASYGYAEFGLETQNNQKVLTKGKGSNKNFTSGIKVGPATGVGFDGEIGEDAGYSWRVPGNWGVIFSSSGAATYSSFVGFSDGIDFNNFYISFALVKGTHDETHQVSDENGEYDYELNNVTDLTFTWARLSLNQETSQLTVHEWATSDDDGQVNVEIDNENIVITNIGENFVTGQTEIVPEPSTASLALLASGIAGLRRFRKKAIK